MLIRFATPEDAHGIAVVHVRAWQQAYRGLIAQAVLDDLSVTQREDGWRAILDPAARPPASAAVPVSRMLVAADDRRILGWASYGPSRDADRTDGELWGLYAHPEHWSHGVGHALIEAVEDDLRDTGSGSAFLWVLRGNARAEAFYERHGWREDGGSRVEERPGMRLHERRRVKALR